MIVCNHCGAINSNSRVTCIRCKQTLSESISGDPEVVQTPLRVIGESRPDLPVNPAVRQQPPETISPRQSSPLSSRPQQTADRRPNTARPAAPEAYGASTIPTVTKEKRRFVLLVALVTTALLVSGVWYMIDWFEFQESKSLFSKGEMLYQQGKYSDAKLVYQDYLRQYPEGDFASLSMLRTAEIQDSLLAVEAQHLMLQKKLPELVDKAIQAFQGGNYLTPEDNNALMYIEEILAIDPENNYILKMKQKIIKFYMEQGNQAVARQSRNTAIRYYETVLRIEPLYMPAIDKLSELKSR